MPSSNKFNLIYSITVLIKHRAIIVIYSNKCELKAISFTEERKLSKFLNVMSTYHQARALLY